MKKLDLDKLKQDKENNKFNTGVMGIPVHVEGIADVKKAVSDLQDVIDNKEEYDFDQLLIKLKDIDKRLDLQPLVKSLEESITKTIAINTSHNQQAYKAHSQGFSKLLDAFEKKDTKPVVNVKAGDILAEYRASDAEYGDLNSYFGFLHPSGKWYVMRQTGKKNPLWRYAAGIGKYREAWRKKETLDYGLYSEVKL